MVTSPNLDIAELDTEDIIGTWVLPLSNQIGCVSIVPRMATRGGTATCMVEIIGKTKSFL
jgi:hypothetical protein